MAIPAGDLISFPLLVEVSEKRAVESLYSDRLGRIREFIAGESLNIAFCPVKRIRLPWDSRVFTPKDPADWTVQVAIGGGFVLPVAGSWPIAYGANTSTHVISNDPTSEEISDVLNGLASVIAAGGVGVHGTEGFFTFTFNNVGARTMLSGDPALLVPASLLLFQQLVVGDVDTREVQILRIIQNAGAIGTLASYTSAPAITFQLLQAGDATHNTKWRVNLPVDRYGGQWTFTKPAGATSDAIGYDDNEAQVQSVFEGIYGTGNVRVLQETEDSFTIELIGSLTHTAVTLPSTSDASGLQTIFYKSGLIDLRVPGINMLLNGASEAIVKFEIQAADATGYPVKVLQRDVLLRRPVLTSEMMPQPVPEAGTAYNTAQVDALLGGLSGSFNDIASSAAGTTDLAPTTEFTQWYQLITATAGTGPYTRKLTLDNAKARDGAIFRIEIDFAQSTNPTIEIYNNTVAGTKIESVRGRDDMSTYYVFEAIMVGTNWAKLNGGYVT
jgi:hypothetical protein